ncbi:protoporphyrinogen/coproporphyrinogen oxidase [Streptomyces sp. NPDC060048]|uniref:protoporphyrinogen/coproporphyrinogen oxidase n=1 Tax=unclassified Streptomyces TaxID=2593676 RepID=UPI0036AB4D73
MSDLDVAVVGAGIAGLTTAYRLAEAGYRVEVFESEAEAGGRMRCGRIDGYTIDRGAETLAPFGYPSTWELIRELGLQESGDVHRIRPPVALWRDGRAFPWLGHPLSALSRAGLSPAAWAQMLRLMAKAGRRGALDPEHPEDSVFGTSTVTELGQEYHPELVDRMLEPISASAFGWTPERSTAAPLMAIMLGTKGILRWRTYKYGQDTMARKLAERLTVHVGRRVQTVREDGTGARLLFEDGTDVTARAVVVTLPSPQITSIYPDVPDEERAFLEASTFSPVMRVACMLDRPLEPRRTTFGPKLYAALIARGESPLLVGCTVEHNKCPERAPAGKGLVSLLISPSRVPGLFDASDEDVSRMVLEEGERLLIDGLQEACVGTDVIRWKHALPDAPPEALALRKKFVQRAPGPIEYAGDWLYLRPSSEAAIASAKLAVPRVRALLER